MGPIDATRLLDELEELDELSPEDRLDPLPAGGGGAVDRADAALVSTISPGEGSAPGTNGDRPDSGGEAATRPPPRRRAGSAGTAQKSASSEKIRIVSGDVELDAHLARPAEDATGLDRPGVVLLHGFPSGEVWAERIGADLPELADRIAAKMGWRALAVRFRGCGESSGDFSLAGWMEDIRSSVGFLRRAAAPDRVWLCGFGTGGALAIVAGAEDPGVEGVAVVGSPADFDDWAANPNRLLAHAKRVGAISSAAFPADVEDWKLQLRRFRAVEAAEHLPPRSLLVLHGWEDELVPHFDARLVGDAHGSADLRFIQGGGHLLRHDPRAVAVLLGWLGRQRASLQAALDDSQPPPPLG